MTLTEILQQQLDSGGANTDITTRFNGQGKTTAPINLTSGNSVKWNPVLGKFEVIDIFGLPLPKVNPTPTTDVGKIPFKDKPVFNKESGQILRYPYEALTDETEYLQIDMRSYNSIRSLTNSLISGGASIRSIAQPNPTLGRSPLNATQDIRENDKRTLSRGGKNKFKSGQGTILLPMPSNIQDGNSVSFSSGNLDGITAEVFNVASKTIGGNTTDAILKGMTDAVKRATNNIGGDLKNIILTDLASQAANIPIGGSLNRDAVFARTQGEIINQNVELLFNGVTLRSFKFSFKFTPRGPKEAQQVGLIINTLKKNMAAKVGGDSIFLETPNVFELTYKRGPDPHPFLHSFKQCVLTEMSVNYTGEGTYAVYNDSTPVSMVLELGFKELEPIYNEDYGSEPGVGY